MTHQAGHFDHAGAQLAEVDGLVEVVNRRVLERAEAAVDAADELVHLGVKRSLATWVASGWKSPLARYDLR